MSSPGDDLLPGFPPQHDYSVASELLAVAETAYERESRFRGGPTQGAIRRAAKARHMADARERIVTSTRLSLAS